MGEVVNILVGKAGESDFSISAQELVTGRTCVIAQSGAGKSYIASGNIIKNAQEQGIFVILVDTENALDEK